VLATEHESRREGTGQNCTPWRRRVPCRYRSGELPCRRTPRSTCGVTRPVGQSAAQATGVKQWPTFPMC
jgi:hypothetical protein